MYTVCVHNIFLYVYCKLNVVAIGIVDRQLVTDVLVSSYHLSQL